MKGLLAERDVGCLFGPPGAGKSLLAPFLAYRIAQGEPFFGLRTKQGPVVYVAAEDESGMASRMRALRGRHGSASFLLTQGVSDLNAGSPDLAWLMAEVERVRPALVVIDTLAMAWPGLEENAAESMGRVVTVARRLTEWGAAVLLVHHDTKARDGTPRGHSLLNGALDMAIALEPRDSGGVIRGRLTKNRNGACDHALAFRIGVATLGVDDDGDPITAAMCEPLAAGEGVREPKLTDKQTRALDLLRDMQDGAEGVSEAAWLQACMVLSDGTNAKTQGQTALRMRDGLAAKRLIRVEAGRVSLIGHGLHGFNRLQDASELQVTDNVDTASTASNIFKPASTTRVASSTASTPYKVEALKQPQPVKRAKRPNADELAALLAVEPEGRA